MNQLNETLLLEKDKLDYLNKEIERIKTSLSDNGQLNFLEHIEELDQKRSTFISKYRTIPIGCESFLVVLRKWNSYTPSLPLISNSRNNINQFSIGGGYFFYIQTEPNQLKSGYGLVIDPGYNFIHNFGMAGFNLDDIDGILITHAHNDHTNDFESLLSLLYQRNGEKHSNNKIPKKVDLFLNVGSFKKFSNYLDLAHKDDKDYLGNVIVMSPGQKYKLPRIDNCEILTLYTKHNEIVTKDYSLGICLKIDSTNILLTGDTGWDLDIMLRNEKFLSQNNVYPNQGVEDESIHILILHIGSIQKEEFNSSKPEYFYKNHLGLKGTLRIIEYWKPSICIISEFGEELTNIRGAISLEIEKSFQSKIPKLMYSWRYRFIFMSRFKKSSMLLKW